MNSLRLAQISFCTLASAFMLNACIQPSTSNNSRTQSVQQPADQSAQKTGPGDVNFQYLVAQTFAELPQCGDSSNGMIYYIWAESKFYICDASTTQWVYKDLTGATGAQGEVGFNSLIEQKVLAAGDTNCPMGGISLTSYSDKDRDGKFTTGVDTNVQVNYLCKDGTAADFDGDTIANTIDNCPLISNKDQLDTDGDTIGDACDTTPTTATNDKDRDGVADATDNCVDFPNASQLDTNSNGVGDVCDNRLLVRNIYDLIKSDNCTECYLSKAYLRGFKLSEPLLSGSNLRGANMRSLKAEGGDFVSADLTDANMFEMNAPRSKFVLATLVKADMNKAVLTGSNFTFANLTGANFTKATLIDVDFTNAILKDADFRGAKMSGVKGFNKATCGCKT